MKDDLIRIVREKLGEGASPEQVIDMLYYYGAVNDGTARMLVVGSEFYRILSLPNGKTTQDVEWELAIKYDIAKNYTYQLRMRYHARKSPSKRGPKKKPI